MSNDQRQFREVASPQHIAREKASQEFHKKESKVLKEWIEISRRWAQEDGKVLLKRVTDAGYTHSTYIGRESKCRDYLEKMQKEGKYTPVGSKKR